jgi:hypothetical protein
MTWKVRLCLLSQCRGTILLRWLRREACIVRILCSVKLIAFPEYRAIDVLYPSNVRKITDVHCIHIIVILVRFPVSI